MLTTIHNRSLLVAFSLLFNAPIATAVPITLDFEGFADGTSLTNQYAAQGVTFSNATVIQSGLSLNEFEFPPVSGQNVIFDDGGFIWAMFDSLVSDLTIHLTYTVPVTLVAFDAANLEVATVSSLYSENFVSSGNLPNEMLTIAFPSGFRSIQIRGNAIGGSFVADNLTFSPISVPDSGCSLVLLSIAMVGIGNFRLVKSLRSRIRPRSNCP